VPKQRGSSISRWIVDITWEALNSRYRGRVLAVCHLWRFFHCILFLKGPLVHKLYDCFSVLPFALTTACVRYVRGCDAGNTRRAASESVIDVICNVMPPALDTVQMLAAAHRPGRAPGASIPPNGLIFRESVRHARYRRPFDVAAALAVLHLAEATLLDFGDIRRASYVTDGLVLLRTARTREHINIFNSSCEATC
jgi:hypothetical protein